MKHLFPRCCALLLVLVLLTASVPVCFADSEAFGVLVHQSDTPLQEGGLYTETVYLSSAGNPRREYYFTYTPGGAAVPQVVYGDSVSGRLTAAAAAGQLEAQGFRVLGGINGDFFVSSGNPIGLMVSGGALLSSDATLPAIGFRADGTAVMGSPALTMTLTGSGGTIPLAGFNKVRTADEGVFAFTYDFNAKHTTGTVEAGQEVLLEPLDWSAIPSIGQSMEYRVVSSAAASATGIAPGQLALSIKNKAPAEQLAPVLALQAGDILTLTITSADPVWADVQTAIGGLHTLVRDGQALSGFEAGGSPRTALGLRANGEVLLYTLDGRRNGHSVGCTLDTLAQRMAELGCVSAICLDGGGSTTAVATLPDRLSAALINRPSDGSQRLVSNLLFLTGSNAPTGRVGGVYFQDPGGYILTGASVNLTAGLYDTSYIPMNGAVEGFTVSAGQIAENSFTAPDRVGQVTLTAHGSGFSASRILTALAEPEQMTLSANGAALSSLTLKPGDQVQLTAAAQYKTMNVLCANRDFIWHLSPELGTVDENGLLTASQNPGSGTLTVSRGRVSVSIPMTITTLPLVTQETFDGDVSRYYGYGVTLAQDTGTVRYGSASLRVEYQQDSAGAALYTGWTIPAKYDRLVLSVYGDGSGNQVSFFDDKGATTPAFTLDFTGWRQFSLPVPPEAGTINALVISGQQSAGTIWLDQAVSSYGDMLDSEAPVITGTVSGGESVQPDQTEPPARTGLTFSAVVTDALDGSLDRGNLRLELDGQALDFQYSGGSLSAEIPAAAAGRRLTLTAWDNSGNRARQSWDLPGDGTVSAGFTDLGTGEGIHWAAGYINYLFGRGVVTGYDGENETVEARPNKELTRAEFAVMLYRWMGLREEDYARTELPFTDLEKLQDWVLPAARAMYALGIIQGNDDGQGGVTFDPGRTLTRAQAVTMLGRIQEKGYPAASLDAFTDSADVPDWAAAYLETMVAQGILEGTDEALLPNRTMTRAQAAKLLWALS